jgi:hypothetical protein
MDFAVRSETVGPDDQSWLGSAHGTNMARTVTLDKSAFTAGTHYPNGFFKSGIPLGKITTSGKYGPYDNAASDGREALVGLLFVAVAAPAADSDPVAALFDHGRVRESNLPIAIDSAGKTDVAGRIIFE